LAAFLRAETQSVVLQVDPLGFDADEGPGLTTFVQRLFARMPRLELGAPRVERIGPELWKLECHFANLGEFATGFGEDDLALTLLGAPIVAVAVAEDGPEEQRRYQVLTQTPERVPLGSLVGGEVRWIRVVVEAAPATVVSLRLIGARAGRAEQTVTFE